MLAPAQSHVCTTHRRKCTHKVSVHRSAAEPPYIHSMPHLMRRMGSTGLPIVRTSHTDSVRVLACRGGSVGGRRTVWEAQRCERRTSRLLHLEEAARPPHTLHTWKQYTSSILTRKSGSGGGARVEAVRTDRRDNGPS